MSKTNNGEPAFPIYIPPQQFGDEVIHGMSLRDYFATNATIELEGYSIRYAEGIVGRPCPTYEHGKKDNAVFWADFRSILRYIEADAMLKAKESK